MERTTRNALLSALLISSLGVSAVAQQTPPQENDLWPASVAPGALVTHTQIGQCTGERINDALVLKGSSIALVYNPSMCDTVIDTGWTGTAFSLIDARDFRDKQVGYVANSQGLMHLEFGATALSFDPLTVAESGGHWVNAVKMMPADLTGNGEKNSIVGINSTRTAILIKNGTTPTVAITPTVSGAIESIAVGYYHGHGSPMCIAITLGSDYQVYDASGTHLGGFQGSDNTGLVTAVSDTRRNRDDFAWLTYAGDGLTEWIFVDSGNPIEADVGPIVVGALQTHELFALDFDSDGDDELGFVTNILPDLMVLQNLRTTTTPLAVPFSSTYVEILDAGPDSPAPQNDVTPIVGNLNHDGYDDVLLVTPPTASSVEHMYLYHHGPPPPQYTYDGLDMIAWQPAPVGYTDGTMTMNLYFHNAEHVDWEQIQFLNYEQERLSIPFNPDPIRDVTRNLDAVSNNLLTVTLPLVFSYFAPSPAGELNNYVIRFVNLDSNGGVKESSRPWILCATLNPNDFQSMETDEDGFTYVCHFCLTPPDPSGTPTVGTNESQSGGTGGRPDILPPP